MNIQTSARIEDIFLDLGRRLCGLIGWREAIGQVFALLYVRGKPLSLDDIAKETNLSKSNVWGIIQQLQELGAVKKVWATENRKDFFTAERDFDLILTRGILPLLKTKVAILNSYLDNAKKELYALQEDLQGGGENPLRNYEDMLKEITKQKDKLESFVSVLSSLGE